MTAFSHLPRSVTIYEVGPRDGLQNETFRVPSDAKVKFIDMLSRAGLPMVEVTSFVRSGAIPQLSDAEEVVRDIRHSGDTRFTALVPNMRGLSRASEGRLFGIALFTAASETFSRHNTNASIAETFERFRPVARQAKAEGLWVRGYVSTAFGCPYEGQVPTEAVVAVVRALDDLGVEEIALSDTIGIATPGDVARVLEAAVEAVPASRLALHFHDTRGTALANVFAGLQVGVTTYDSSAGGLGGCPYAPGAAGNLATEDLVFMLDGMGIHTGVSLHEVVEASRYLAGVMGKEPSSRYYRASTA